jgi:hypothetical protein
MNEPPPIAAEPSTASRFARRAATFSILAPVAVLLIGLIPIPQVHGTGRIIFLSASLFILLIIFSAGLVFGIMALTATKRCGRKGIYGKAMVGVCINGLLALLTLVFALGFLPVLFSPRTPQGRLDKANKKLAEASTDQDRFYALDNAAKENFEVGKMEDADKYARELLTLAPTFQGNWNYGNAIQDGNLVLGRIALHEGRTVEAKQYLLEAGKSPGSPTMNSFGPNMSLARDLLEKGERETVLQYFELCRKFWEMDDGKLDQWSQEVKADKIPRFGANLVY